MAHTISLEKNINLHEPMYNWSCRELIVHFGMMRNIQAYKEWKIWSSSDKKSRGEEPPLIIVEFITNEEFEELLLQNDNDEEFDEKVSEFFG